MANHVNPGGITAYMLNLCTALHGKDGFEYVLASRGGEMEKEFAGKGVEHIRIPLFTKCEVSPKVLASFFKLKPLFKSGRIDCIHANTRVTQVLASMLSSAFKVPYISTCHGYFKPRLSRRLLPCWGRKVIAISDQVGQHLITDFGLRRENISLVYNGIDLDKFRSFSNEELVLEKKRLGLSQEKKIIGHIGRLSVVKGQKYLIDAAERLAAVRSDVQFLIIGDGDQRQELKKLVEDKNLKNIVLFSHSVIDITLALAVMDVFAMPSLQEGLGLSLLEAQAAGVAVVASRVGGIPTAVSHQKTGLLCNPGDGKDLAVSIARLLDDGDLRQILIENARKQSREKFSLSGMAAKTGQVYSQTIC